jgi:spore maturation protein SpmB
LDARPKTCLVKKGNIVAKFKEVKTESNLTESSKEGFGSKTAILPVMIIMLIIILLLSLNLADMSSVFGVLNSHAQWPLKGPILIKFPCPLFELASVLPL